MTRAPKMRLLFVCSRCELRSPTAEKIFSNSSKFDVRARGLKSSARRGLASQDVTWAEVVFVMEPEHKRQLMRSFRDELRGRRLVVLNIPDEYDFMDPELIELIRDGVQSALDLAE